MTGTSSWARFLVVVAILAGTAAFLRARSGAEDVPAHQPLSAFPMEVGEWAGQEIVIHEDVKRILGDGEFIHRAYFDRSSGASVALFIAYFPTQRTGSTMHSPQNCLPGAGWSPVSFHRVTLRRPDGSPMVVNRYIIGKGPERQMVYYWYQAHGRVVASEYWAKFWLVADSMRLNRSDGALVRMIISVPQEENAEKVEGKLQEFARAALPLMDAHLPR
jgi:EpsI family protein